MLSKIVPAMLATGLAVGAAQAQEFTPKAAGGLVLTARITGVSPSGTDPITTLAGAATPLRAKVGDDIVPTLGLTYFLTDNLAVEAIAGTSRHTVRAVAPGTDVVVKKTWVVPPIVTLQYHMAPGARVSPYVGAGVNYMLFHSGSDRNGFNLKIKDGFGAALQVGVDLAVRDRWTVNLDAKKVFFDTEARDSVAGIKTKVTLDPWVLSAGIGHRF